MKTRQFSWTEAHDAFIKSFMVKNKFFNVMNKKEWAVLCDSLGLHLPEDAPAADDEVEEKEEDEEEAKARPKIDLLRTKLRVGSHSTSYQDQANGSD